ATSPGLLDSRRTSLRTHGGSSGSVTTRTSKAIGRNAMGSRLPVGEFTCPITFESIRPPKPAVKEEDGVTYSYRAITRSRFKLSFASRVAWSYQSRQSCLERTVKRLSSVTPLAGPLR